MRKGKKILIIDDDELLVSMLERVLIDEGYEVKSETDIKGALSKIWRFMPDIVILDINFPGGSGIDLLRELKEQDISTEFLMLTADDTAKTAVMAMKLGAADYLTKPVSMEEIKVVIDKLIRHKEFKNELEYHRTIASTIFEDEFIGESEITKQLKEKAKKLAQARVQNILITGESGTGKELMARYIHKLMYDGNHRSRMIPFIAVNCAALPETLLESELFGYEKGAFTDARTGKKGIFEMANGGTILLDEIGEMRPSIQSKLLRVLETKSIRRLGGNEEVPVDVTIIATTNRNLKEAVRSGVFRDDLFFRISTFYIHIPPLRERREDIPILAKYFLEQFSFKYNKKNIKGFSRESENILKNYYWPGNVRELKNLIERLVVLETAEEILPSHLPNWLTEKVGLDTKDYKKDSSRFILPETGISLEELEKDLIIQALKRARYNKALAAKLLNISYDSLRYQIKKFRIDEEIEEPGLET